MFLLSTCVLSLDALAGSPSADWHAELLSLHNTARREADAPPLRANKLLALAAQRHADHMARTGKVGHKDIGDGDIPSRIEAAGYPAARWGENIAWGPAAASAAQKIWMESKQHREQLLAGRFAEVGFGRAVGAKGVVYWVACFGRQKGSPP